jgi:Fur family iron response transcriptional regulator
MEQLKFHTDRLRTSGLRPTKQRLVICKILVNRKETFHFTIDQLKKIAEKNVKKKIRQNH